ncbi:MAG: hypothetical protein AAF039_11060 [Bacteroidota bacterium]
MIPKKILICCLTVGFFWSCMDKKCQAELSALTAELDQQEKKADKEQRTRQFVLAYIEAVNSPNWKNEMEKFMKVGPETEKFLEEHTEFRKSFPNFRSSIKHIAVNGDECILWLEETANFAAPFSIDNGAYGDKVLNGVEARGQSLAWNEVWYFNVVDGKFGSKWDFLKDNYTVLKKLGAIEK